jgi:hypothetical protein
MIKYIIAFKRPGAGMSDLVVFGLDFQGRIQWRASLFSVIQKNIIPDGSDRGEVDGFYC